jgi:hypothetical protein
LIRMISSFSTSMRTVSPGAARATGGRWGRHSSVMA